MRYGLIDLIVFTVIATIASCLTISLLPIGDPRFRLLLMVLNVLIACLVVSSPLYRWLHFQPLLLPKCPVCQDRNRHYWTIHLDWPEEVIECATCHVHIFLCLDGRKCGSPRSDEIQFCLKWPYSFAGRWRRMK